MSKIVKVPFNKPSIVGQEMEFIADAVRRNKISGNGYYTQKSQRFFEEKYGFNKCLLTTSCTDALEMAAILCDVKSGDEIIMPSYTFVSTANAFILRGAKAIFADSLSYHPNVDSASLEALINERTKAIVVVHYAGMACDMDAILAISSKYNLYLIEDAAQAVHSFYKGRPLGSFGDVSCFSFHETKNIIAGEGGMICVNKEEWRHRAEIIWEKGTDRSAFFRGEVDKYGWVDIGSSFLPSELTAAYLYGQLEKLATITNRRIEVWRKYWNGLSHLASLGKFRLMDVPVGATLNGHLFAIYTNGGSQRSDLITYLNNSGINVVFHYLPLHKSQYYKIENEELDRTLKYAETYGECLVRLPLYYSISDEDVDYVIQSVLDFYLM